MSSEALRIRNSANWFDVKLLAPGLYGLGEFGHVEEVISFLVVGADSSVLIDTGTGLYSMREAVGRLTDLPCSVLNTHSHFDHVGNNFEFERVALLDHPDNRRAAEHGFTEGYLSRWATDEQFWGHHPEGMRNPYRIPPFRHARFFRDGDAVSDSFRGLVALHTPGHSDDSVCFFHGSRGWLFSGDFLYNGPIYIERDGGLVKFRRSIQRIVSLDGLQRIFSSHNDYEFSLDQLDSVVRALGDIPTTELEEEVPIGDRLRLVPS